MVQNKNETLKKNNNNKHSKSEIPLIACTVTCIIYRIFKHLICLATVKFLSGMNQIEVPTLQVLRFGA